jgi:ubiquinol-cytochrome c reductase cytochrome b subunit
MKDFINLFFLLIFFLFFFLFPFVLGDFLIFEDINFLVRPIHIVPEWYFLFFYAILRSVENKFLGLVFFAFGFLIFFVFLFFDSKRGILDVRNKIFVFILILVWFFLIFIGGSFLEEPFLSLGKIFNFFYFYVFFLIFLNLFFCDYLFF